jgi:hypothetical protein
MPVTLIWREDCGLVWNHNHAYATHTCFDYEWPANLKMALVCCLLDNTCDQGSLQH